MGYSVFQSNLLAIPGYALFAINVSSEVEISKNKQLLTKQVLVFGWLSEKLDERLIVAAGSNLWMLPFFIGLICIKPDASPWVRYALITGINGIPYTHSILVGLTSRNARSVGRRAVATAVYNMTYQIGSVAAVNIYRDGDKPFCE